MTQSHAHFCFHCLRVCYHWQRRLILHTTEVLHMKISGNAKCLEISTHRKKSLANYLVTIQVCDHPSCANSKNLVLVKHFVGG